MSQAQQMRYFSPVAGRVVERFGSGGTKIGATRTDKGYVINLDAVVAIPLAETKRYIKEYRNLLRDRGYGPDLIERTKRDYDAWLAKRKAKAEADAAALKAKREAQRKELKAEATKAETDNDSSSQDED